MRWQVGLGIDRDEVLDRDRDRGRPLLRGAHLHPGWLQQPVHMPRDKGERLGASLCPVGPRQPLQRCGAQLRCLRVIRPPEVVFLALKQIA
jgi:hypothetical protein